MPKESCESTVINLGDYATTGTKEFTSRSRGTDMSRKLQLQTLVHKGCHITMKFPEDISGINTIFLEEFLEPLITYLKDASSFSQLITIDNHSLYNVEALVNKAVKSLEQKKGLYLSADKVL